MGKSLSGKAIIVIGATGGLGSGIADYFSAKGARLLLAGRNSGKLKKVSERLAGDISSFTVDVTDPGSVSALAVFASAWSDHIDVVVNASGCDVRKSLDDHTDDDIRSMLNINLMGSILITKIFLPYIKKNKSSSIFHIGGFADGRLAFPYYSVDVASRAGLFSFIESMNRELAQEGSAAKVCYFCPSPADTDAERPYHHLWEKMDIAIIPVEKVAESLLEAIVKRRTVTIMGGFTTTVFAKLNLLFPRLADIIMMKRYGNMLKEYFYGNTAEDNDNKKKAGFSTVAAIVLIALSCLFYGLLAVVTFLPVTLSQKAVAVPVLLAAGEITWWTGVAIAGKKVIDRYKKNLNPCRWFTCKTGLPLNKL